MAIPTAKARIPNSGSNSNSSSHAGSSHIFHAHTAGTQRRLSFSRKPARPAFKRNSIHAKTKRVSIEVPPSFDNSSPPDDDTMASSFLQYCTVCESQIINPDSSILYCSEKCRRKDADKPLTTAISPVSGSSYHHSPHSSSPITPSGSYKDLRSLDGPFRDILPQRSPTTLTPNRFSHASLSSAADSEIDSTGHDTGESSDQGFGGLSRSSTRLRPKLAREDSEAARYLRQFQSPTFQVESSSAKRSKRHRNPRSISSASLTTSIGQTPSLTSSPGTSPASTGLSTTPKERTSDRKDSGSAASMHAASASLLLLQNRPLAPRTNPLYSSSVGAKNVSLVTPLAPAPQLEREKANDHSTSWSGRGSQLSQQLARARAGVHGIGGLDIDVSSNQPSLPGFKGRPTTATSGEVVESGKSTYDEEWKYEKRSMASSVPLSSTGTLKSLFEFEKMQAAPTS